MCVYYFCLDTHEKSAGIRTLYRHVEVLTAHGIPAAIMHNQDGFRLNDVPPVPVRYLSTTREFGRDDVLVIPEISSSLMKLAKDAPVRRMASVLNWDFVYFERLGFFDYRMFGIERVLTHSPSIAELMAWTMKMPAHLFKWGINSRLFPAPVKKRREVVYIERKQDRLEALRCFLFARDPRYVQEITWTGLSGMSESDYALAISRAAIFLNLSRGEGLPCSALEAMRCGTLVAGYSSIGGQRELIGGGPSQNAVIVETMDYPGLARQLEPALVGMLRDDLSGFAHIIRNAQQTSAAYTLETEEASIVALWRELLTPRRT